jgi:hypothetical protein
MAKFQSPLLGYNNNVRHKGKVFHIQTEDSGVQHPHVITHLFMDGGRILKSIKKSYAEHVGSDSMSDTVRALMKEQHKGMLISLRDGAFDHLLDPKAAAKAPAPLPSQTIPAAPPKETIPPPTDVSPPVHLEIGPMPAVAFEPPPAPATTPDLAPLLPPPPLAPPRIELPPQSDDEPSPKTEPYTDVPSAGPNTLREGRRSAAHELATSASQAERHRQSAEELTLDFDALDRDLASGPISSVPDLPPPPANLFAKYEVGTGRYRALGGVEERTAPPARAPRAASSKDPQKITEPPPSLFGEEVVGDQSLDEVILSYLAEDLDPSPRE